MAHRKIVPFFFAGNLLQSNYNYFLEIKQGNKPIWNVF